MVVVLRNELPNEPNRAPGLRSSVKQNRRLRIAHNLNSLITYSLSQQIMNITSKIHTFMSKLIKSIDHDAPVMPDQPSSPAPSALRASAPTFRPSQVQHGSSTWLEQTATTAAINEPTPVQQPAKYSTVKATLRRFTPTNNSEFNPPSSPHAIISSPSRYQPLLASADTLNHSAIERNNQAVYKTPTTMFKGAILPQGHPSIYRRSPTPPRPTLTKSRPAEPSFSTTKPKAKKSPSRRKPQDNNKPPAIANQRRRPTTQKKPSLKLMKLPKSSPKPHPSGHRAVFFPARRPTRREPPRPARGPSPPPILAPSLTSTATTYRPAKAPYVPPH